MNDETLANYQSAIIAAQTAGAVASHFAGTIVPFLAVQVVIAAVLAGRSEARTDQAGKFTYLYFVSLAVSLPFIGPAVYSRTVNSVRRNAAQGSRGGQKLKKEMEEHIKAGWGERMIDLRGVQFGASSLQKTAVPIVDVLSGSDMDVKRKAIVILQKLRSVRAIGLLRQALSDPSVEIKFMAASALLSIENEFKDEIKQIASEIERASSQGRRAISLLRRDMAVAISRYIASGLLDEVSEKNFQEQMISELASALRENHDFFEVRLLLAKEYSKKGMFREALSELMKIIDHPGPTDEFGGELKVSAVVLYCEIHYNLQDYGKLREACRHIGEHVDESAVKKHPGLEDYYRSIRYFAGKAER